MIRVLPHSPVAHSGTAALRVTYLADEDLSLAQLNFRQDSLWLSQWVYFEADYDFTGGQKIARIDMKNEAADSILSDNIIVLYGRTHTAGRDDMGGLTFARNGGANYGYADNLNWARNTWYHVECMLKLNTPGQSNGAARCWVNDSLVLQTTGMGAGTVRPNSSDTNHIRTASIGGWYSNGGLPPSSPATYYIDDVAVDTAYIPNSFSVTLRGTAPAATLRKVGNDARRNASVLFGENRNSWNRYDSRGRFQRPASALSK